MPGFQHCSLAQSRPSLHNRRLVRFTHTTNHPSIGERRPLLMRILMVTSYPLAGQYDGTAMLSKQILWGLQKRASIGPCLYESQATVSRNRTRRVRGRCPRTGCLPLFWVRALSPGSSRAPVLTSSTPSTTAARYSCAAWQAQAYRLADGLPRPFAAAATRSKRSSPRSWAGLPVPASRSRSASPRNGRRRGRPGRAEQAGDGR